MSTLGFLLAGIFLYTAISEEEEPLVDLQSLDPTLICDLKYATTDNFMNEKLYPVSRCYLRERVARKIVSIHQSLRKKKLGLKIYDAYRPHSVQKKMWAKFPLKGYVANPLRGSNHNRGAAVDLTLVDGSGRELPMPTPYDEFSPRAHRDYQGGSPVETEDRRLLEEAMAAEGFKPLQTEWWHFDDADAAKYSLLDIPLELVESQVQKVKMK